MQIVSKNPALMPRNLALRVMRMEPTTFEKNTVANTMWLLVSALAAKTLDRMTTYTRGPHKSPNEHQPTIVEKPGLLAQARDKHKRSPLADTLEFSAHSVDHRFVDQFSFSFSLLGS